MPPPIRPHLLSLPKWCRQLVSKCSKTWDYRGPLIQPTTLHKSENLSSDLQHTHKSQTCCHIPIISGRGSREEGTLEPSDLSVRWISEGVLVFMRCSIISIKSRAIKEDNWHHPLTIICMSTGTHTSMYMHTHIHTQSCTYQTLKSKAPSYHISYMLPLSLEMQGLWKPGPLLFYLLIHTGT